MRVPFRKIKTKIK